MKKLLTIALLLAVAASASALDRSPRKKKRDKKAKTETVVPAPVPEAEPVPVPEPEPAPAEEPVVNDMTLGFSPEQTDSLLAAWRERQRQDAFSEFFKQYILEDSTEVADSTPDSVYSRRLLDLASPIQFPYNSIVKGYINRYTNSRYGTISRILGMSQYYFPIIEEELAPRRPSRRAARAADHRIGALPHGGVADGRRRAVAVHAHDRQELRTRNQLAGRRTPRPLPRHAGRLPLPERPLRHL